MGELISLVQFICVTLYAPCKLQSMYNSQPFKIMMASFTYNYCL